MREIKYRAWDKENKKMLYGVGVLGTEGVMADFVKDTRGAGILINPRSEKFELAEFIGLEDKNGKKIYEGDIVIARAPYQTETRGVVKYIDMGFKIDDEYGTSIHPFSDNYEVIGNIYENSDLLKI